MPSPIIYDASIGSQTARAIVASDTAFGSGVIQSGAIGDGAVVSGSIASGQVGAFQLSSGSVVSGRIASGNVGWPHLASGAVRSGHIGDGAVVSGSIASGQIWNDHFASGVSIQNAERLTEDGFVTEERISGTRAIAFSQSGRLRIAMAAVSGRMPAIGVLTTNVESGQAATFNHEGRAESTGFDFSGYLGRSVFVGSSGTVEGAPPSASGNVQQRMGVAYSFSGLFLKAETEGVIV